MPSHPSLPPLKAVTFDLGGTLVEYENVPWEELEANAWRQVHAHLVATGRVYGGSDDFTGAMMKISTGYWERAAENQRSARLHDIFAEGLLALGEVAPDPDDFEALAEHFHAGTLELVSVYDDSLATLAELRRRGIKLALISNTAWPGRLHTRDLERFSLDGFFDVLTYSSEQPHTKPHASIFLNTLAKLGEVPPECAAHVGDRLFDDVQGAQRAGLKGILKAHPRRIPVEGIEPDASIATLSELPAALDRLFG